MWKNSLYLIFDVAFFPCYFLSLSISLSLSLSHTHTHTHIFHFIKWLAIAFISLVLLLNAVSHWLFTIGLWFVFLRLSLYFPSIFIVLMLKSTTAYQFALPERTLIKSWVIKACQAENLIHPTVKSYLFLYCFCASFFFHLIWFIFYYYNIFYKF